jgi:hypothetical protein
MIFRTQYSALPRIAISSFFLFLSSFHFKFTKTRTEYFAPVRNLCSIHFMQKSIVPHNAKCGPVEEMCSWMRENARKGNNVDYFCWEVLEAHISVCTFVGFLFFSICLSPREMNG